LAPKEIIF